MTRGVDIVINYSPTRPRQPAARMLDFGAIWAWRVAVIGPATWSPPPAVLAGLLAAVVVPIRCLILGRHSGLEGAVAAWAATQSPPLPVQHVGGIRAADRWGQQCAAAEAVAIVDPGDWPGVEEVRAMVVASERPAIWLDPAGAVIARTIGLETWEPTAPAPPRRPTAAERRAASQTTAQQRQRQEKPS